MNCLPKSKIVNGYEIIVCGGFITVRSWSVYKNGEFIGTYFKFGKAKEGCLKNDFSGAFKGEIY